MKVLVAIPSYDRPKALHLLLEKLSTLKGIVKIVIVADSSSEETYKAYKQLISQNRKIVAELGRVKRGSARARNVLLDLAAENLKKAEYVLLLDDDYIPANRGAIPLMARVLENQQDVGIVCGNIINVNRRALDPDFALKLSSRITDSLTRASGFLLNPVSRKTGYVTYTTPFMLIRGSLLGKISYDESYMGTGYREESDFQMQVHALGYRLLYDRTVQVYHLSLEEGGCRENESMNVRMYWKARNHTYFILKWNGLHRVRSLWFMVAGAIILTLYRPSSFLRVLKGLQDGYRLWSLDNR